ncbi:MAG TPA: DinB family protein [Streptosporangiaceae bacterium]
MTWTAPDVTRPEPPEVADERTALQSWLDYHRTTLRWKCAGLSGTELVARPVQSSGLSLLGLVRHMAEVERSWFRYRFGGQRDLSGLYCTDEYPDGDFDLADPAGAEADFGAFSAECAAADDAARGRSLDDTFVHPRTHQTMDLRWIYLHMIEEYARHNGHADLIRELIDGVTGD